MRTAALGSAEALDSRGLTVHGDKPLDDGAALLMTVWRPGKLPSWTQRWPDRLVTSDQKFNLRYDGALIPGLSTRLLGDTKAEGRSEPDRK